MNHVVILGRLTKDIEVRYTQSQKAFTNFTVAVNRRGKEAEADFITCQAWEKTAEFMQKHCKKGMRVAASGRIQTGSYTDKDGKIVYTTDVVVSEVTPIWDKKEETNVFEGQTYEPVTDDSSELPF